MTTSNQRVTNRPSEAATGCTKAVKRYATAMSLVMLLGAGSVFAGAAEPDTVQGRVVDAAGAPIANAQVTVRYQSNPGGISLSRSAKTDADGWYRLDVSRPPGVWTVHADAPATVGGREERITLLVDDESPFAGNDGAVRNFRLDYSTRSNDAAYGAGGMLVVSSAIGDYTPLDEVRVVLVPVGGGETIEAPLVATGDGHVVTGLIPQPYRVRAFHRGEPMLIAGRQTATPEPLWADSHDGDFERTGPGIFQLRVEVKTR